MPWWIIGLSLFAASISSTTLIGQSGDAYHTGIAVFNYNLAGGVVVMVFFATFLLPLYIKSGIFTIPEFLEKRFDKKSRYYFSGISILSNVFLDAAGALYAAALIIKLLFPAADLQLIIIIFAILAASYTIPGGLSSAISAEIIQAIILIVGSIILTFACFAGGGAEHLWGLIQSGDLSAKLIRPLNDPATPWLGLIVGMPISGMYFWANNQTLVQRVLSAKNINEGRKGVMFAGFLTVLTLFIIVFPGIIARFKFPGIEVPDMIYPTMVMKLLPVGLLGIMLSALLAALTSTISAILNSTSTLFTMDFYAKANPKADSKKLVKVGKISALVIIVIAAIWAPNIGKFGSLLKYYQEMLSYIAPPIVAAFLMGIFSKRSTARGAFAGLLAGLVAAVVVLIWRKQIFGDLHFLMIIPFLLAFSMLVIFIVSRFDKAPSQEKLTNTVFGVATGPQGPQGPHGDSMFKNITPGNGFVTLEIEGGTIISIPLFIEAAITLDQTEILAYAGDEFVVNYTLSGTISENAVVTVSTDGYYKASVVATNATSGNINITCPDPLVPGVISVNVFDNNTYVAAGLISVKQNPMPITIEGTYSIKEYGTFAVGPMLKGDGTVGANIFPFKDKNWNFSSSLSKENDNKLILTPTGKNAEGFESGIAKYTYGADEAYWDYCFLAGKVRHDPGACNASAFYGFIPHGESIYIYNHKQKTVTFVQFEKVVKVNYFSAGKHQYVASVTQGDVTKSKIVELNVPTMALDFPLPQEYREQFNLFMQSEGTLLWKDADWFLYYAQSCYMTFQKD